MPSVVNHGQFACNSPQASYDSRGSTEHIAAFLRCANRRSACLPAFLKFNSGVLPAVKIYLRGVQQCLTSEVGRVCCTAIQPPLSPLSSLQRFSPAKRPLSTFWSTVVCELSVMRSGLDRRMSLSIPRVFVPNSTSISRYLSKAGQSHRRFNARSHSYGCFVVGTNVIFPAVVPVGKSNSVFVVTWLRS